MEVNELDQSYFNFEIPHLLFEEIEPNDEAQTFLEEEPKLGIIKQPTKKYRFRYESESFNTTRLLTAEGDPKGYPTIRLYNYQKPAIIRCILCTTAGEMHCHSFMVRENQKKYVYDPYYVRVTPENDCTAEFKGGIISTTKNNVSKRYAEKIRKIINGRYGLHSQLSKEERMNLDPRNFAYSTFNVNKVVMRFDAFESELGERNEWKRICDPIFSEPISNRKSAQTGDLKIVRVNSCSGTCLGGQEIFLLVEKISKDIKVRFFDDKGWHAYGDFGDKDIHRQYAIVVRVPPYGNLSIEEPVTVKVELVRGEDCSKPIFYTYIPHSVGCEERRACMQEEDFIEIK